MTLTFNKEDGRRWNVILFALLTLLSAFALLRTRRTSQRCMAIGLAACWAVVAPLMWIADFHTS